MNQPLVRRYALQILTAAITVTSVLFSSLNAAPPQDAADTDIVVDKPGIELDKFLSEAEKKHQFSGSVLVAKNGKVVLAKGYGHLDDASSKRLCSTTLFELGSTTKAITAIAVFRLQELGKLQLDDSISKYLPDVPQNCTAITIRHLLQHTSGIPPSNPNGEGSEIAKCLPSMLAGGPQVEPGKVCAYWNGGYALLSEIIAVASGSTYEEFCVNSVFAPCEMVASRFTGHTAPDGYTISIGKSPGLPERTALDHPYGAYGLQYRGMGGMVSNVWDIWRLDRALASEKLLSKKTIDEMTSKPIGGYSPGWQVATLADGSTQHGHSGSVRGYLSEFRRYPTVDGCVVIQSNRLSDQAKWTLRSIAKGCEQTILSRPIDSPFFTSLDKASQESIHGVYINAQVGQLEVSDQSIDRQDYVQASSLELGERLSARRPASRVPARDFARVSVNSHIAYVQIDHVAAGVLEGGGDNSTGTGLNDRSVLNLLHDSRRASRERSIPGNPGSAIYGSQKK